MVRSTILSALVLATATLLTACDERPLEVATADAGTPLGLSSDQAARVVAKVGDKTITLGDFAKSLERMNQFDRLRYQAKERRRELLDDLIDVELLAAEAKRRGLDKRSEVQDAMRQTLRDALLAKARDDLPAPAELSKDQVRAYYEQHIADFSEPERRRVGAIVVTDRDAAKKVLEEAQKIKTAGEWGTLAQKHAPAAKKGEQQAPADLAGDLGIVGAPDDKRGGNKNVPDAVRAAVFKLGAVGAVADTAIEAGGKFYIVRLTGKTEARKRTMEEAERSIRVLILQQMLRDKEQALEDELRKKYAVQIDDEALKNASLPQSAAAVDVATQPTPYGSAWAPQDPPPDLRPDSPPAQDLEEAPDPRR